MEHLLFWQGLYYLSVRQQFPRLLLNLQQICMKTSGEKPFPKRKPQSLDSAAVGLQQWVFYSKNRKGSWPVWRQGGLFLAMWICKPCSSNCPDSTLISDHVPLSTRGVSGRDRDFISCHKQGCFFLYKIPLLFTPILTYSKTLESNCPWDHCIKLPSTASPLGFFSGTAKFKSFISKGFKSTYITWDGAFWFGIHRE